MVTVEAPGLPTPTLLGSAVELIVRVKISSPSQMLSSVIETSNGTIVCPAGNMTVYGPVS